MIDGCQNAGICMNDSTTDRGYVCQCLSGFNGTLCEVNNRPCQESTCWNNGNCFSSY